MDEDRILAAIVEGRREQRLEIADLRQEVLQLRTQVMDRFDRVENRLTDMGDDITVAMAAATTALRQQKEVRTETLDLVETMTVIQRKVRRLRTDVDEIRDRPAAE